MVSVQNRYNLVDRGSEEVLELLRPRDIGFIPWFPLATGDLAKPGGPLDARGGAARRDARAGGDRLAAQAVAGDAPDPRHLQGEHLEENTAAALLDLDDSIMAELDRARP